MAHQIQSNDNVYLAETGAWHGLGKVFKKALGGDEVCKFVVPWEPEIRKAYYYNADPKQGGKLQAIEDRKVILRSDTQEYLGTVGINFSSMGNREMFDLVEHALPGCKYETAGTLFGGRRVWALARINEFEVMKGDVNKQYLMIANGHDGSFRLFFGRTDVRVVCNNTLTAAISGGRVVRDEDANDGSRVMAYKHTAKMKDRLHQAVESVKKAQESAALFAQQAKTMAKCKLTRDAAQDYFKTVFPPPKPKKVRTRTSGEMVNGAVVLEEIIGKHNDHDDVMSDLLNGYTEVVKETDAKHAKLLNEIVGIFDGPKCSGKFGSNVWTAFNAVTDYVDHKGKDSDDISKNESKFASQVWGGGNTLKQTALQSALALV